MSRLTYRPGIFEVPDLAAAKRIILTPAGGQDTETRWARETPYLADLMVERLDLKRGQMVIDYGCGIGRLAKALIERVGCFVLGVDFSQEMRGLAPEYVDSAAFSVVSRSVLHRLSLGGFRADAALSAWVLQHCQNPSEDIGLIGGALREGAPVFVLNAHRRVVPTVEKGWFDDGQDVRGLLKAAFREEAFEAPSEEVLSAKTAAEAFWGLYRA